MDSYLAHNFYYSYEPKLNLLENIEKYDTAISDITRDLNNIWFWKLETISGFRLDELVLDFTDAFSADGDFLGVHSAMHFNSFTYQAPKLTIHAPTRELEELIRDVFIAKNH